MRLAGIKLISYVLSMIMSCHGDWSQLGLAGISWDLCCTKSSQNPASSESSQLKAYTLKPALNLQLPGHTAQHATAMASSESANG